MDGRFPILRFLVGLAVLLLLGGCATGASPTPAPPTPTPVSAVQTPVPGATAAETPTPTTATPAPTGSAVAATTDVSYESTDPLLWPGKLDVYAPVKAGSWPVVVMFPGSGLSKDFLAGFARGVAELGFVAFVADWGHSAQATGVVPNYQELVADTAQGACAVAFAQSNATQYGGDPATIILFGHSAGANEATMIAFLRPAPTAGCLGGTEVGPIHALVTWEGDFLLADPVWNSTLAADPRPVDAITPWKYLAGQKDLKVVMLVSDDPGANMATPLSDAKAADAFFKVRDPSGDLRTRLEAMGALADGSVSVTDEQELLLAALKAQGNPVSLDVMPGSSHTYLSDAGRKVFLAAFGKAVSD